MRFRHIGIAVLVSLAVAILFCFSRNIEASGVSLTTQAERRTLHSYFDRYEDQLIRAMEEKTPYHTISFGAHASADGVPGPYGYNIPNFISPDEYTRKTNLFVWAEQLAKDLSLRVYREDGNYVWAEIGDPDAPEMVMAFSHLDSPTNSVDPRNMERWWDPVRGPWRPKIEDGWIYGCGIQDDSGPTIVTLFSLKALQDAGFSMDRRVRVLMGGYEDCGGLYVDGQRSWFDVYRYKRSQEIPIGAFTSDSRFPTIYGNTGNWNRSFTYDVASDAGKDFSLVAEEQGIVPTTPFEIIYGSGVQIPSSATFYLRQSADGTANDGLIDRLRNAEANANRSDSKSWRQWKIADITQNVDVSGILCIKITVHGVQQEAPTPHYGKNALLSMMYLMSEALPEGLQLKKAASDVTGLLGPGGVEDNFGVAMGIGGVDARVAGGKTQKVTVSLGYANNNAGATDTFPGGFHPVLSGDKVYARLYARHLYENDDERASVSDRFTAAWTGRGWAADGAASNTGVSLYVKPDSPLIDLFWRSYNNSLEDAQSFGAQPESWPLCTTGGTYAGEFWGKMVAYGAVIPGGERWWHAPNERVRVESLMEQGRFYADAYLELARYGGSAGAKPVSVDVGGWAVSDMLLLDNDIGTYKDVKSIVSNPEGLSVLAATAFEIPILKEARTSGPSVNDINSGNIYLKIASVDVGTAIGPFAGTDRYTIFALPQRVELKVNRSQLSADAWKQLKSGASANVAEILPVFVMRGTSQVKLSDLLAAGEKTGDYFSYRMSSTDDAVYVGVNIAVLDKNDTEIGTVKTSQGSFFTIGDGRRDAVFTAPDALFVASRGASGGGGGGSSGCNGGGLPFAFALGGILVVLALSRRHG